MSAPMKSPDQLLDFAKRGNLDELRHYVASECNNKEWLTWSAKKSGDSVVTYATRHGHLPIVEWLHKEHGSDLEIANLDGKRPLHEAAQYGEMACLVYLLDQHVQIDCLKRADW